MGKINTKEIREKYKYHAGWVSHDTLMKCCNRIDELEKTLFDLRHRSDFKGVDDVNEFIDRALR